MHQSVYDMPFEEVMRLYEKRLLIEAMAKTKLKHNNRMALRQRTALLRLYPELFDDAIIAEIKQAHERALKLTNLL